jgi:hypothetical protein
MIYFNPIKFVFFMLLFAAMTFGDVNATNTDLASSQKQTDIREDSILKTPLVEKGLPKLQLPVRKFVRNVTTAAPSYAMLDKIAFPKLVPDLTLPNKKTT